MSKIESYKNGNYIVYLDVESGAKMRDNHRNDGVFVPEFPECCDLKITSYCDVGCPFCYESSDENGTHIAFDKYKHILKTFHPWTEVALGGGSPILHPEIDKYLDYFKSHNIIASITVNRKHFEKYFDKIEKWIDDKKIYGVGVSENKFDKNFVDMIAKSKNADHYVIHTIAGLTTSGDIDRYITNKMKILILGYKKLGRGSDLVADEEVNELVQMNIDELASYIGKMIYGDVFNSVVSFDNLALLQMNIEQKIDKKKWDEIYLGDDGVGDKYNSASMYLDLVNGQFSRNSISSVKHDIGDNKNIDGMYKVLVDER